MYYPKQVPYLLDDEFKKNIEYNEYRLEELNKYCFCIWTMKSKDYLSKTIYNNILPDACIDIIIDFVENTISFVGFSKKTIPLELKENIDYMGVRLKPGAFYGLFKISADNIVDSPISFSKIEKEYNLENIFLFQNKIDQINILKEYLLNKIKRSTDDYYIKLVDELYIKPNEQNVVNISKKLNYDKRHLLRVFKKNYGISPKILLNILRLHLCLTLILEKNMYLSDVATICGFYDQSHFIKEIKKYTGISPLQLLDKYKS